MADSVAEMIEECSNEIDRLNHELTALERITRRLTAMRDGYERTRATLSVPLEHGDHDI